ncbi:hypothetical protein CI610_03601 [invertebrate metagenome]|uniref:Uncharacterized protein n=1 Tax=invertebrate metagenome TaxID=1711999 RepID=A0A2H9T2M7_9ZZZZ
MVEWLSLAVTGGLSKQTPLPMAIGHSLVITAHCYSNLQVTGQLVTDEVAS